MRPTNEASASEPSARFDFSRARRALLNWFKTNGRAFPWRDDPAPYRVWISEIMLQQTTTQTALGYFERFLERFPDVNALASASEEETLKYWEGLGYYRRARALRQAAIQIVERFQARFPSEYDDVLSLPGVGRYAAGAILSFGFDKRFPILEANTTRLHARLLALRSETSASASQKLLWRFAEDWLPKDTSRRPKGLYRDINGALTDLGRLVCAPREPRCGACPLAQFCESERLNLQNVVPVLKPKPEPIRRVDAAIVVFRADLDRADNVGEVEPRRKRRSAPTPTSCSFGVQKARFGRAYGISRVSTSSIRRRKNCATFRATRPLRNDCNGFSKKKSAPIRKTIESAKR